MNRQDSASGVPAVEALSPARTGSIARRAVTLARQDRVNRAPRRWCRPASRRQQRKTETRERLLNAASELFAAQGFDETTYDDIASAARVARQTVFNYYPRKEDFVIAWGARRREAAARALAGGAFAGEQAVARLALMMRVLASSYERSPAAGRVYTMAWVKWGGPILEDPILAAQFAAVITEGQRLGEIRADVSAETAGQLLRAAYFDALWRWASPSRPEGAPSLLSDLLARLELLLTGLCVKPQREGILAHELRSRDVTVNAVAPGPTATDMFLEGKDQELRNRMANAVPLERLGVPDDIAPVVAFLASPAGHRINGQTVRVNGGII